MKKLFLSTIALAMVFAFTSCKDDVTPPEITLPTDASVPVFQLGDKTAALNGVTAKDKKDGDVTSNLGVEGLEYVDSAATLIYSVSDEAANMAVANRTATISAEKLFGNYGVSEIVVGGSGNPDTYNVTVGASQVKGKAALIIDNFYESWQATFVGKAGEATLEMIPFTVTSDGGATATVSGQCTYSNNGTYTLVKATWKLAEANKPDIEMEATYTVR